MSDKRILFVTIPEKGHINPMIGVAQRLQQLGFKLAFFSQQDVSVQLEKAGLFVKTYYDTSAKNISEDFITKGQQFVQNLADKAWLHNWIKTLLIDAVPAQVNMLELAVADFAPDLIVTDPMIYAAPIVANRKQIPWAGISSSLNPITPDDWQCDLTHTLQQLHPQREALLTTSEWNPRFKVSDVISPWLNIVYCVEDHMPRALCGNDFSFYTGNSFPIHHRGDETDFPFHLLAPGKKHVYMSMGSQIYYHPHLFHAVAEALPDDDIQLIFSINELYHTTFKNELPANVLAVPYAPQLELLPHVQLVISHGGANSVMETLSHGIPIALLPICNDQFLQAKFVTRSGNGIVLDPTAPSPEQYRKQLLPLLDPQSPQAIAAAVTGKAYRSKPGVHEAAQLIEQLYHSRQPIMPV